MTITVAEPSGGAVLVRTQDHIPRHRGAFIPVKQYVGTRSLRTRKTCTENGKHFP